jgi:hypothetical protein
VCPSAPMFIGFRAYQEPQGLQVGAMGGKNLDSSNRVVVPVIERGGSPVRNTSAAIASHI